MNTPQIDRMTMAGLKLMAGMTVLAAAFAAAADASPLTMQVTGVDWSKGGDVAILVDGHAVTEFAGAINIKLDGIPFQAMCVDLFTGIGIEAIPVNPFSPFTVNNAARAAWLFVNQFGSVTTAVNGEALQLAIWDIIHDGGDGLSAGRVRASVGVGTPSAVVAGANQYLSASVGQTSGLASVYISVNGPTYKQSLMSNYLGTGGWTPPSDQGSPVPEPGGMGLSAIGMATLAAGMYWKRRRAQ